MYCSVCGGSIDGEAPVCSSCGTRQPVAEAPALPQPLFPQQGSYTWKQPRSYNWGQIHGGLCFLGGVSLLSSPFAMRLALNTTCGMSLIDVAPTALWAFM
jgi:hypothetical protein